ncbi:P-loop containing nucleoside triphosphate hydrolase protein [Epithele typhae]|uniref:P-loop containing nucleoside triphosphate hydrolase protein n=1 Tax=Epithele typhae TaxID=378194 RepID=UPI002007AA47|nr:P-loop containing nucleoside triphosphate hydrolase protein [Epithele typhae]KAH9914170.1 P-loop containing nucleoside triphosphate hydrolase protein [Epithele typhae]
MSQSHPIRIVLFGDDGVKTLMERFKYNCFDDSHFTDGDDFALKAYIFEDVLVYVHAERPFGTLSSDLVHSQIHPVNGFLLIYSIASRPSFESISAIHRRILTAKGTESVPAVLVSNKIDEEHERQIQGSEGEELAKNLGCSFVEISAKQEDVDVAFERVLRAIRAHELKPPAEAPRDASSRMRFRLAGWSIQCVVA